MLVVTDEVHYSLLAKNIADFADLSLFIEFSSIPPMYSLVIAPAYLIDNMHLTVIFVKLINVILMFLGLFPIYLIGKEIFKKNKKYLVYVMFLLLLMPFFFWNFTLMSENLFFLFFQWCMYFLYKYSNTFRLRNLIFYSILIGLCLLTKVSGFLLLPYFAIAACLPRFLESGTIMKKLKRLPSPLFITLFIPLLMSFLWVLIKSFITNSTHSMIGNFYHAFFFSGAYGSYDFSSLFSWFVKYAGFYILEFGILLLILPVVLFILILMRKVEDKKIINLCLSSMILFVGFFIGVWLSMGILQARQTSRYTFHIVPFLIILSFYLLSNKSLLARSKKILLSISFISLFLITVDLFWKFGECANFDSVYKWSLLFLDHFPILKSLMIIYFYIIIIIFFIVLYYQKIINPALILVILIVPLFLIQNFVPYYIYYRSDSVHNFHAYSEELIDVHESMSDNYCLFFHVNWIQLPYYMIWNNIYDIPIYNYFFNLYDRNIPLGNQEVDPLEHKMIVFLDSSLNLQENVNTTICGDRPIYIYSSDEYNASIYRQGAKTLYYLENKSLTD